MRPVLIAALLAGSVLAAPARAHVTIDPQEAPAGGYVRAALRVPHGCPDPGTSRILVRLPEGVLSASPMPKPGWRLSITRGPAPAPGRDGRVTEIAWEGGPLPEDQYEEFVLMLHVAGRPGETLALPVLQGCAGGFAVDWAELPAPGRSLERPAPLLRLVPGRGHH
ncbi:YcnI family protein [Belnapia sp. T6]|uniref:YcnI family protein n=1 Tax=Belnapia mucosa TaxID=2804532 RepID=A0ABS1UXM2_9PROT|nr:YcnI family protein [Belnapia mucosa]MBL6454228.1 YcnI family protein [Belnapia mucosa]